ncbi:hypothetical protein EJ110_NYTH02710 [Nymphaea thermarum]|nr:hypothetical protein EJ110_NYTH02710 [Nymphaea thermarum]
MASKTAAAASDDYQPTFEWIQEQENHILQVKLRPEFTKEDLKVQIDTMGSIRVGGEHKKDGQKPIAFRKSFRLPDHSNRSEIRARFQDGVLKVIIPFQAPPKKQPPASEENARAAGGTTIANKKSEDESRAAGDAKPPAGSGGEGGRPADKSETPGDKGTAEESRKQSQDNSRAAGKAAPSAGSGGEEGRPADRSVDRGVLGTKDDRWSRSKYINRLSVGLKTRRKQIVSVGIGILVLSVALGFYAAYRLGESAEDGN